MATIEAAELRVLAQRQAEEAALMEERERIEEEMRATEDRKAHMVRINDAHMVPTW